jgi:hypothetical protein
MSESSFSFKTVLKVVHLTFNRPAWLVSAWFNQLKCSRPIMARPAAANFDSWLGCNFLAGELARTDMYNIRCGKMIERVLDVRPPTGETRMFLLQ